MARPGGKIPGVGAAKEMTIDQLAAAVQMTVRNVRAYASRGLIPAPKLVGRTGYYSKEHVDRLLLVRDLLERGYTLSAVEDALERNAGVAAGHALELLEVLNDPRAPQEPVMMTRSELARLASVEPSPEFVAELEAVGLVERSGDDVLLLREPAIVRAGAQAVALGLSRESVLALLPFISDRMAEIAERFVHEVTSQLWQPFVASGFPEDEWPRMLNLIEQLLPIAGQAVVAVFRRELNVAIDEAMGKEIARLDSLGEPPSQKSSG